MRARRRCAWLTVRSRLTLTYGGLFAVTGTAMLVVVYMGMRYGPTYLPAPTPAPAAAGTASPAARAGNSGITSPTGMADMTAATKDNWLHSLLLFGVGALAVLILIALALGWFLSGRMLAPLQRVTRTARRVAIGDLHQRIELHGPRDEITELADTFDMMLDRLDASFQAQQRFAANASHELRTPLATAQTMLQVALADPDHHDLRNLGAKLLDTNRRSIEITEALLALARADHGTLALVDLDLAEVLREALEPARVQALAAGVTLVVQLAPALVSGERVLLHRLAVNLIDNAIRHNHRGGTVDVALSVAGSAVHLTVRNTGALLTAEQVLQASEPFHRLGTRHATAGSPGGHGLGLPLARSIAKAHCGRLQAEPCLGGGLVVEVVLPG